MGGPAAGSDGFRLLWDDRFLEYDFGPQHPFQSRFRSLAIRLLEDDRVARGEPIPGVRTVPLASRAELGRFHTPEYLELVEREGSREFPGFLDRGDTPAFPGCFDAAARMAGGFLAGLRALAEGPARRALHPGGGLHHAQPGRASGFCVFNDIAVGIANTLDGHGSSFGRIAYVDIDAHHGDGVMYGFFNDGRLLDIDFHQDGRTLFPGTGTVDEVGQGDGAGKKANIPMPPGTGDREFTALFRRIVPRLLQEHRPELLILQHGMDAHRDDPLAQLALGPESYRCALGLLARFGEERSIPLLVTGGGGYLPETVARGLARAGIMLADRSEGPGAREPLPEPWRNRFLEAVGRTAPERWEEAGPSSPAAPLPRWAETTIGALSKGLGLPL
jgi:acetoin utilization protein AcuC